MNIYLISQSENAKYDTYDSCVVSAESEIEAAKWNPDTNSKKWPAFDEYSSWCDSPKNVTVKLVGHTETECAGFILKSYNAG